MKSISNDPSQEGLYAVSHQVRTTLQRRVRVRSAGVTTMAALEARAVAPKTPPEEVPEQKSDKILIALHFRSEMPTSALALLLATMPVTLLPALKSMEHHGTVESKPESPAKGAPLVWKLTQAGAKAAVFALHRDRKNRPKTVFVGGNNPWTGAKMRK